mgnify:CR=1 FL=1
MERSNDSQYLALYNDHKSLLKYIAKGESIEFVLDEIIKSVEQRNSSMICSIFLLDESKDNLFKCAAPSIPSFYTEKLNNMTIGEKVGSCGAAAFLKKRVIVEDISTHENWKYAKKLAERANFHACWSQPFFSSSNDVLGTFAIYYDRPKKPTKFDLHLIEDLASITGIAVEKHNYQLKEEQNIQEREKQEQLLMHKSKQSMMGEMLENIAHQWRQPLSVISTCATGILVNKECGIHNDENEKEVLRNINLNVQYLSNTINDFRDFFTSNAEIVEYNIKDCLEHTCQLNQSRLKNNAVKIISSLEDIKIKNFKNEMTQVFMNVFNNAFDVLETIKTNEKFIDTKIYTLEENVVIKIIDSGNGASEDILDRIFDPYFTTKHQKLGTGIGLYMCKEIIQTHMGGTISAKNNTFEYENKSYKGLEITISLPL